MERLIDADEFVKECDRLYKNPPFANPATPWDRGLQLAVETALRLPRVDAVEVVRCRDCKHRGTDYCIFHIKGEPADEELLRKLDNDFCSYGERKEGTD